MFGMDPVPVKKADGKGRVTLGPEYANKLLFVIRKDDGMIEIRPAETVPSREAWLFRNPDAIASVMWGLVQARAGEFAEAPDLEADAAVFEDSEGD